MADNALPHIVRPAERGSKREWATVTGEIPTDLFTRLNGLARALPAFRTDLVREGVELVVAKYEQVERRTGERRKGQREDDAA